MITSLKIKLNNNKNSKLNQIVSNIKNISNLFQILKAKD